MALTVLFVPNSQDSGLGRFVYESSIQRLVAPWTGRDFGLTALYVLLLSYSWLD